MSLISGAYSGHFSTTYGVNSSCILSCLPGFDITNCLPYDIMHTIFEGVASHHLHYLLRYYLYEERCLTLNQLNDCMKSHNYGYSEQDTKPTPIKLTTTGDLRLHLSGLHGCMFLYY